MFKSRRKTGLLAAIIAFVLVLGISSLAAARWQTEITASGSVSTGGNWDVKITSASVQPGSGVTAESERPGTARGTATVYDVRLQIAHRSDRYVLQIDDTNPRNERLTAAELAEFDESGTIPTDDLYYKSGKAPGTWLIFSFDYDDEILSKFPYDSNAVRVNPDGGASEGLIVGKAIAHYPSNDKNFTNRETITANWASALDEAKTGTAYDAIVSEDGHSAVFDELSFALPGAWAIYDMTVTNEGSVNANLESYALTAALPDGFTASLPDLSGEILLPGESCHISFVIQLSAASEISPVESAPFTVSFTYAQDEVPDAPAPTHSHS